LQYHKDDLAIYQKVSLEEGFVVNNIMAEKLRKGVAK
jgi:hypothetical protein